MQETVSGMLNYAIIVSGIVYAAGMPLSASKGQGPINRLALSQL